MRISARAFFVLMLFPALIGNAAERRDFHVVTEDGMRIFVRQLIGDTANDDLGPLLLVNGGRPGVLASWDLDVPGPSIAEELASAGHSVYLMDARGFGRSEHTREMKGDPAAGPIAVRSHEVVRDIKAVVSKIRQLHPNDERLAAMGWATGSQWLGHYASLYPKEITRLVFYQAVYGGEPGDWPFQSIAAAGDPALLDREQFGAYRCSTPDQFVARLAEKVTDARILERYVELAMEGDDNAYDRVPPCVRFPSGPLADTLMMVNGRPLFDAGAIEGHVLILRSENDFWSRPQDVATLIDHLDSAASVTTVELTDASHYVHLIPDARDAMLEVVKAFTSAAVIRAN